jgi:hypothetical protein
MPRKTNFGGYGPFSAPNVPVDEAVTAADLSGQVFYVNANATGADDVDTPFPDVDEALCFSTLQGAIDACVASRGDTIIIKRGSETTVTTPVLFNKPGIRVITQRWGMSPSFRGEYTALLADATYTDGPVAQILDACYIEGLGFVSRDTGTTFYSGAALLIGGEATAEPYGVHLFQCRFPKWNVGNSKGIGIEGSTDCLIEECYFEGVGADFATGIYVQGATQNLEIRNCRFRDCDYAITLGAFAGGGPNMIVTGNIVQGPDSKFMDTGANTATGIVCNNYFMTDQGTSTFDRTVSQIETQGIALTGNWYSTEEIGAT